MNIYVIRHGETNANKNGVLQGISDWPLNEDGIKLAEITGQNMKDIKFDICYSSPLDRAYKTAELVLENSGNKDCKIVVDDRIIEINMGIYEGRKIRPVGEEIPFWTIFWFKINPFVLGKFKKGESVVGVCRRTQKFLKEVAKKDYENILVSTHGGAMRAMLNMLYKRKWDFWQGMVPYNCAVNIIEVIDGKMELVEKDKIYYDKSLCVDRFSFKDNTNK